MVGCKCCKRHVRMNRWLQLAAHVQSELTVSSSRFEIEFIKNCRKCCIKWINKTSKATLFSSHCRILNFKNSCRVSFHCKFIVKRSRGHLFTNNFMKLADDTEQSTHRFIDGRGKMSEINGLKFGVYFSWNSMSLTNSQHVEWIH